MMKYQKIAVAIDFSKQSLKAFDRATVIAKDNGATLLLINVIDTKSFGAITAYDLKYADQLKVERAEQLEKLKEQALAQGVQNVMFKIETGSPKSVLTNLPDTELIICGETGYNQIEKLMLGSVAERIVRYSKYDVLVVR